jgi:hypothetical protein
MLIKLATGYFNKKITFQKVPAHTSRMRAKFYFFRRKKRLKPYLQIREIGTSSFIIF